MKTPFLIIFLFLCAFVHSSESLNEQLLLANDLYRQGVAASTVQKRQKAFNDSLKVLLTLEKKYTDSAPLSASIGDNLFQLEEYSWAIFYYYKSLKHGSDNETLHSAIFKAQEQLQLPQTIQFSPQDNFFSVNQFITSEGRYQLFFGLTLVTFIFASLTIWWPLYFFSFLRNLFLIFSLIVLLNLLFSYFIIPNEAIVIHTSPLYRNAVLNSNDQPLTFIKAGTKVRVLDIQKGEKSVKIEDKEDTGYLSLSSVAIL